MRGTARILIIGSNTLGGTIAQAIPGCQSVTTDTLLAGVWSAGQSSFDAVVLSLSKSPAALRAIRALRQVSPQARIIVTCTAAQEPQVGAALQAGADEYILEPLAVEDLAAALGIPPPPDAWVADANHLSLQEIIQLSEVLKNLGTGWQPTLDRLAALLRRAFTASGVTIQVQELAAISGAPGAAVLEEPLQTPDGSLGRIGLGARHGPPYAAADAARLSNYARLIETIVAQLREQEHWQELAWRDDLSGLRNRRYFDATLDELVERATRQRLRLSLVLFDIDDFKTYNDQYGHDTGDALLREVGVLLTRCSRESDVVARYGGDEFAVVFWDAEPPRIAGSQHPSDALALAERFRAVIREHAFQCLGPDAPGPVTLSGGLACFPWDGKTRAELLKAADEALRAAKRAGKNHILLAGSAAGPVEPESPPQP